MVLFALLDNLHRTMWTVCVEPCGQCVCFIVTFCSIRPYRKYEEQVIFLATTYDDKLWRGMFMGWGNNINSNFVKRMSKIGGGEGVCVCKTTVQGDAHH